MFPDGISELLVSIKNLLSQDSGNAEQSKEFPSDIVVFTGANSAVGLCLMTVRYFFLDDVCLSLGSDSEGDPLSFAFQRYSHFYSQNDLIVSAPKKKVF